MNITVFGPYNLLKVKHSFLKIKTKLLLIKDKIDWLCLVRRLKLFYLGFIVSARRGLLFHLPQLAAPLPCTDEWGMRGCFLFFYFFDRAPDCKRIRWQLRCNKINCLLSLSLTPAVSPSSQCPTTKQWCQICLPDVPPRYRKCFVHTLANTHANMYACAHTHLHAHKQLPWNP